MKNIPSCLYSLDLTLHFNLTYNALMYEDANGSLIYLNPPSAASMKYSCSISARFTNFITIQYYIESLEKNQILADIKLC